MVIMGRAGVITTSFLKWKVKRDYPWSMEHEEKDAGVFEEPFNSIFFTHILSQMKRQESLDREQNITFVIGKHWVGDWSLFC